MARYIDADEALRVMRNVKSDKPSYGDWELACDCCIGMVEVVPTADVVEVVRCKDCKDYGTTSKKYPPYCNNKMNLFEEMKPDDFCSYGEKRTK